MRMCVRLKEPKKTDDNKNDVCENNSEGGSVK